MSRFSVYCGLLLISSWYRMCMGNPFLIAFEVGEKTVELYDAYQSVRNSIASKEFEASNNQIYEELQGLRSDLTVFKAEVMEKLSEDLKTRLDDASQKFFEHVKNIQGQYETFLDYSGAPPGKYENTTLHNFANNAVASSLVELPNEIKKLQQSFIDRNIEGQSLISIIVRNSTGNDLMCVKHESKQQIINDLHKIFVKSSIKGLMVILYSYELKAKLENRKYEGERERAIALFTNSSNVVFNHVRDALKLSSREVWSCDPQEYRRGDTYDKLQEVFQAYVFSEADSRRLNEHTFSIAHMIATGRNGCGDMGDELLDCKSNYCKSQPSNRRCEGHIRSCQDLQSSQICHAPGQSDRRYDWLRLKETDDHAFWGRNRFYSQCDNTQGIEVKGSDVCVCTCESEKQFNDRHFSLHSVLSDVKDNKVVTGVKLVKHNHVFQIQIEQGTLGPNGTIIDQPKLKDFKKFSQSDLSNEKVAGFYYIRHEDNIDEKVPVAYGPKNDLVYTVKYARNHVYLDTLDAGPNRVVTGLKFQHDEDDSLKLEIQTTEINYDSGKLKPKTSSWTSNSKIRKNRKELKLNKPDDPTKVNGPNKVLSTDNQYVDFRMTDLDHDFGQYTVPFLDLQSVTTTPRMPLSGAGLILKGQDNSGGFLAFKVIHYDYTNHV